ncbi:MAG: signal peptide peptidase SppA [Phycisphaerae bacterium]|jgi:protease-4
MDYQDNNNVSGRPEGANQGLPPQILTVMQKNKKSGWGVFWGILLGLSVLANFIFFIVIIGLFAVVVTGHTGVMTEKVLIEGPRSDKIAVIRVEGIIDSYTAQDVIEQIQYAKSDVHVRAIILSVNSPGGTISASDQIHNEIIKFRNEEYKPVVAFMQSLAASGGYYISVTADEIVAEPTTITGSIGVIMGYLVLEDMLQGKLGIEPIIIKSGQKKDWPSSFHYPSEEELMYFQEKVIDPAFERFKNIVTDGRIKLTVEDVNRLADGSIFSAEEALSENLIDEIGYFDDAVNKARQLAGLDDAQVVEYVRPFSLSGLLGSEAEGSIFKLDKNTIYELSTPQVMYLWSIH